MANITISDLPELTTTPAGTAVVSIVDGGSTQKITVANIKAYMQTGTFVATTVTSAAQPNISSVGTLANLSALGNVTASYFIGNGSILTDITGANITGTVANANYAAYAGNIVTAAQPNITSTGTLTSVSVTGNVQAGNVRTSGLLSATGKLISSSDISLTGLISAGGNIVSAGTIYTSGMFMGDTGFTSGSAANVYDVDTSGTVASYASSATVVFENFSGMIIVNSHTTGGVALWLVGGNAVQQIGSATGSDTGTITYSAGTYIWTNNTGITADVAFAAIRTRQAS